MNQITPRRSFKGFLFALSLFSLLLSAIAPLPVQAGLPAKAATCEQVSLHYRRAQGDYEGWGLHVWGPTVETVTWEDPLMPAGKDDYGVFWLVPMAEGAELLNYIVHKGDEKDPGPDQTLRFGEKDCKIWLVQGRDTQFSDPEEAIQALIPVISEAPVPGEDQILVHYRRTDGDYPGWGLHVWGPVAEEGITWTSPLLPDGQDEYGLYWLVDMQPGADVLNFIVHKGDQKDPGPDQSLDIEALGNEIWLIQGSGDQFTDAEVAKEALFVAGVGDIKNKAQAHWLSREIIAWPIEFGPKAGYLLHYDPDGNIKVSRQGLQGGQTITLEFLEDRLSPDLAERYPHLKHAIMLKIPEGHREDVPALLKGQVAVSVTALDGTVLDATGLQLAGVLDDLYANDETLGLSFEKNVPTLRVWAPTARSVTLHLFPNSNPKSQSQSFPMNWDPGTGVWSLLGLADWIDQFYLYEVEVYVRQEGKVVRNFVTDPYSLSLAMNSIRSQIVDLNDPALVPAGWDRLQKPLLDSFTDIAIYELHLRDFSASDPQVPPEHRGTYLAFTHPDSHGMQHLQRLAQAGLTHVHLLPVFDIATIEEDKDLWLQPDYDQLIQYPPDSERQQAILAEIRGRDGYNWGYDPFHYTVPEGSYATNPDGSLRTLEFRRMVMALNQIGLRLIMDVAYNHTHAAGQSDKSVLDRVVPGYYHRLDANGNVTTSTCCPNTASEHAMMEKLIRDSVLTWAKDYKIDGFRFDLMGHHMVRNIVNVRATLDSLTLDRNGIDGQTVYVYGEGWNFGEVADNARGLNATQQNMAGSGIGTFNDRVRDAVRGGGPFQGLQEQGFATGLFSDPNQVNDLPENTQRVKLLDLKDQIRISLAGNLADFPLQNAEGRHVTGKAIGYNGSPAGYTHDPQENVVYVSAHDNETLFDAIQYKAPLNATMDDRVRMQNLALSVVALSQGVPFFHAGGELLRSKSLDRDSYESGDWFNRLDFTYQSNNWGVGLPPHDKNGANWPVMKELLSRPELRPGHEHILATLAHFEEMLRIRKSSPLFHLRTGPEVIEKVRFHNTGPDQIPGLIVMSIRDDGPSPVDENYGLIFVLFNADPQAQSFTLDDLPDSQLALHPIQASSNDAVVRQAAYNPDDHTFTIPGRTTAVFVRASTPGQAPPVATSGATTSGEPANTAGDSNPSTLLWLLGIGALTMLAGLAWQIRNRKPS